MHAHLAEALEHAKFIQQDHIQQNIETMFGLTALWNETDYAPRITFQRRNCGGELCVHLFDSITLPRDDDAVALIYEICEPDSITMGNDLVTLGTLTYSLPGVILKMTLAAAYSHETEGEMLETLEDLGHIEYTTEYSRPRRSIICRN